MLKTMTVRATIAAILVGLSMSAHAIADPKRIDIPAGDLRQALLKVSETFGADIVFSPGQVEAFKTQGAQGELTTEQAITKLLEGTPLQLRTDPSGAMLIAPPPSDASTSGRNSSGRDAAGKGVSEEASKGKSFWNRLRIAQVEPSSSSSAQQKTSRANSAVQEVELSIPEILVVGSKILNTDILRTRDDVQPYMVFDRRTIDQSGAKDIEDFFRKRLTASASASSAGQEIGQGSPYGSVSSINLRGIGADQTLVLIDGRRVSGATVQGNPQQPNLNGIPLAAVERIEVLATTASGIYGGSATGGVVNVVLRRDYSGLETNVTYGDTFGGGGANRQIDIGTGFNFEGGRTNVLLAGSFRENDPLLVRDRNFLQRARAHILANDPTFFPSSFPPVGRTTNIYSAPAFDFSTFTFIQSDLTLKDGTPLNSPIAHVPNGYSGVSSDGGAALLGTAGQYNLEPANSAQSGGGRSALLGEATTKSVNASIRREFTSRVQAFMEFGASDQEDRALFNGLSTSFFIPSTAPNNPFAQDIYVSTPAFGADEPYLADNDSRRAVGGIIVKLSREWQAAADYSWSRARSSNRFGGNANAAGADALASGTVDVLRDTNVFPVDFESFVSDPFVLTPTSSTVKDTAVRLAGPVGSLPAGSPVLSLLVERREESFGSGYSLNAFEKRLLPSASQSVDSLYMEAKVPLISATNHVPAVQLLELQLAGRRDEYTIRGAQSVVVDDQLVPLSDLSYFSNEVSSTNPTIGLRYQPVADVMFRGSYAEGFLPPSARQLPSNPATLISGADAALLGLTDPLRGNEPLGDFLLQTGGNEDIKPERSKSWSAGIVLMPSFVPRLRLSFDWTNIKKTDNISSLSLTQFTIEQESVVPSLIVRGAPSGPFNVGPITELNLGLINVARAEFEAYDLALDYAFDTSRWGAFDFSVSATHLPHIKTQTTLRSPVIENAGVAQAAISSTSLGGGLRWRGNAALTWTYNDWKVGWATQYYHSYWINLEHAVVPIQGSASIPRQIYHDAFIAWNVPTQSVLEGLSKFEIQFGVRNVFDKAPPIDLVGMQGTNAVGYSAWGDPRLANYYLSIRTSF